MKRAFTLVEILASLVLLGVFTTMLAQLLSAYRQSVDKHTQHYKIDQMIVALERFCAENKAQPKLYVVHKEDRWEIAKNSTPEALFMLELSPQPPEQSPIQGEPKPFKNTLGALYTWTLYSLSNLETHLDRGTLYQKF